MSTLHAVRNLGGSEFITWPPAQRPATEPQQPALEDDDILLLHCAHPVHGVCTHKQLAPHPHLFHDLVCILHLALEGSVTGLHCDAHTEKNTGITVILLWGVG